MSVKISQMPVVTTLGAADLFPILQSGLNVTVALANLVPCIRTKNQGCVANGVTDDSAKYQNTIIQSQLTGLPIFIDPGTYLIGTALNITGTLTMYGAGRSVSILKTNTATQSLFNIATTGLMTFSDFQVQGKNNASAGNLINLDASGGGSINQYSTFERMWFQGGWIQFNTGSASGWSLDSCLFFSPLSNCVVIQDTAHPDAGDMQIIGCTFSGQPAVATAILQFSAGGLRMTNCKVIQFANGYTLSLGAAVATSDLFIGNCSFEAFSGTAVTLTRGTGTVFGTVQITNNEFNGAFQSVNIATDAGPWIAHVTIADNNMNVSTGGTACTIQGCNDFTFHDNTLGGTGGTGTGLALGTVLSNGTIHDNTFLTFGLAISGVTNGTNIRIHDNIGYNPVGASALAPGASPWTLTNGPTRASVSLAAATSITGITFGGVSLLAAAVGANTPYPLELGPNEAVVITYTGALTARQMIH